MSGLVTNGQLAGHLESTQQVTGQLETIPRMSARLRSASLGEQFFWFGTRAEYNALESIDSAMCYCIEEGT